MCLLSQVAACPSPSAGIWPTCLHCFTPLSSATYQRRSFHCRSTANTGCQVTLHQHRQDKVSRCNVGLCCHVSSCVSVRRLSVPTTLGNQGRVVKNLQPVFPQDFQQLRCMTACKAQTPQLGTGQLQRLLVFVALFSEGSQLTGWMQDARCACPPSGSHGREDPCRSACGHRQPSLRPSEVTQLTLADVCIEGP